MLEIAQGWTMEVNRGPDWLFVKLGRPPEDSQDVPPLADAVWTLLEQNLTRRLVLECEDLTLLNSVLIGQLLLLQKRILAQDGMMRVCGLTRQNQEVLSTARLGGKFPHFRTRNEAVMTSRRQMLPR